MSVHTSSGSKIYIGTTATDPVTDSFIEIGHVVNIPEFGRVYTKIEFNDLGNRNVQKFKGQRDDGSLAIDLGRDPTDAGQAAIIGARDDDHDYNFKVTLNDDSGVTGATPTAFYFKAQVFSYTTNVGNAQSVVGARVLIEIQSGTIEEVAAT